MPKTATAAPVKPSGSDVRVWARANGYQVGDVGRISAEVHAAYAEAHKS